MRIFALLTVIIAGGLFLSIAAFFPDWGSPLSPASSYLSPYFITSAVEETGVPNIVTAVLGDYRSFDTMFEVAVVFCAGAACFFILGRFPREEEDRYKYFRHIDSGITLTVKPGGQPPRVGGSFERTDPTWVPYDFIISRIARLMIPFIQIYGLYVLAHGHISPGGGFQGGVILAASFLLLSLSHNMRTMLIRIPRKALAMFSAWGVFIFAGYGALCLFYGGNFLDYSALSVLLGVDKVLARYLAILIVEIGVTATVMSTMLIIYNNVASSGAYDEGL